MIPALMPHGHVGTAAGGSISSAGVFDSTGRLVRTIWSAQTSDPRVSNPAAAWDGTLDNGTVAATGTYTIKLLQHNLVSQWDGAIGNTSPDHSNMVYHNEGAHISDMEITSAGEMYYVTGYNERWPVVSYTTTASPQVMNYPLYCGFRASYNSSFHITTDSTITYVSNVDGTTPVSGVYGINCSTKALITFSSGTTLGGSIYNSVIFPRSGSGVSGFWFLSGLSVQRSGSYIFATFNATNELLVANKTTGATVHTLTTWTKPGNIATSPTSGDLWLAYSPGGVTVDRIIKLNIDGAGNPTASGVLITGFSNVIAMDISPDGATLLVVDGKPSDTVKAFNTSDGSVKTAFGTSGVFGTAGGYANSPTVTNTKFMFKSMSNFGGTDGWIAYVPADSSWWLGDAGNNRTLHFSSGNSPSYIEQIAYIGGFYSCQVDTTNTTRVTANFLEFQIDYSLATITPTNGSWTLLNNWGYNFTIEGTGQYTRLHSIRTYSNGRRYAFVFDNSISKERIYELTATGTRDTGIAFSQGYYYDANFNSDLTFFSGSNASTWQNQVARWAFTGFDGSNNPTWAASSVPYFSSVVLDLENDFPQPDSGTTLPQTETLANGILPFANGFIIDQSFGRVGGCDFATGEPKFSSHRPGPQTHGGFAHFSTLFFDEAPFFANTGGSGYGGGFCHYVPNDICFFTCYRGESWGNNQTSVWSMWHQSGLLLARFGPAAPYYAAESIRFPTGHTTIPTVGVTSSLPGIPCMQYSWKGMLGLTGNTGWGGVAKVSGTYYVYGNDEWYHGGITRWSVKNINTLAESQVSVSWNSASYTPPNDPTNLLQGLPYAQKDLVDNTASWHISPASDHTTQGTTSCWIAYTNAILEDRHVSPDIACEYQKASTTCTLYRTITRSLSGNWSITATVYFQVGMWQGVGHASNDQLFIQILDGAGKKILELDCTDVSYGGGRLYVNGTALTPAPAAGQTQDALTFLGALRSLSINMNISTGKMDVTYDTYTVTAVPVLEVGANPSGPTKLQLMGTSGSSPGASAVVCFTKLKFVET